MADIIIALVFTAILAIGGIVILTGNVGARDITDRPPLGFGGAPAGAAREAETKKEVTAALSRRFKRRFQLFRVRDPSAEIYPARSHIALVAVKIRARTFSQTVF